MGNFAKENKMTPASTTTAGAAGTSTITGATLDLANFDQVTVVIPIGTIVSGAATSVKWQEGDASNLSDAADVVGTGQTIVDTADDTTIYINIVKPRKRYGRVVVSRATQNSTFGGITYIQSDPRSMPVTQGTNVSGESWVSPALGTA
jgi:hypothetical protein